MRRQLALLTVVLSWISLVVPQTAVASTDRHYRGTTSAGSRIAFGTTVDDGGVHLVRLAIRVDVPCEDGSALSFAASYGFDAPIAGGVVAMSSRSFGEALIVSGHLGPRAGTGTIRMMFAALDEQERPQICDTGELAWEVARVERRHAQRLPAGETHTIRVGDFTRTVVLVAERSPTTAAENRRVRHYRGRIMPEGHIEIEIRRADGERTLRLLGIGFTLECDDGTAIGLDSVAFFGGGHRLEPGRIDLDERSFDQTTHVHGRLGPHTGEGTTSMTIAALDVDLEPQACSTGERTWSAWRTDPGASRL